ncbi:MAG: YHS domain-containing (seleno)protein [Myxococcota bacterium]
MRRFEWLAAGTFLFALACTSQASAQRWNRNGGEAVAGGYDVVAYQTEGRARRGRASISYRYEGGTFWFATEENRDAFAAAPARYVPAYGGFCAYAMADGRRVRIDPEAFSVVGGRLYLNYSPSVKRQWLEDRDDYIDSANEHWQRLRR